MKGFSDKYVESIIRNLERDDIYDVIFVVIRPSEFEERPPENPTCLTIQ